jgi:signal transduction histidine kinase
MPLRRQYHKASFRTKVLVPVVLCMVALIAATVFVVEQRIKEQLETEARDSLAAAQESLQYLQKDRKQNFLLRFQNLPSEPHWRALFQNGDPKTLHEPLQEFLSEQGVQIVSYTSGSKGVLDSEVRDPSISVLAFQAASMISVEQALQGDNKVDTVFADGQLYDVTSIPVRSSGGDLIGVLTLGSAFGAFDAQELGRRTHSEIALLADGQVVASTFPGPGKNAQLINLFTNSLTAAGAKPIVLGDEHYYSVAGRLETLNSDHTIGYVLLSSYEKPLVALHRTQQVLLAVSFCAILIGAAIVWFLISKATRPLRELRDSAEAVGRGDFSRRVLVRSKDECGELAIVFNQMTENLQQSRLELEKTVETLKNTQEQLIQSEKLSGVGEFVAGVTHELNNPLAAVMGFSEMLKDADVDVKHRRYLEMIHKSAQRCQKIVQSLLSFARRHQPERTAVSVNILIATVLEIVQYHLRTSNIEVITQLDQNLPVVFADPHQMQQVILNIINNARQAIESNQPQGWIKIITEASESNVRIIVQDSGPGIPEENLRRIFDPFFTTKQVGQGTGLGLSLCYGIVKEHGGTITPLSRRGEGATFIIELPVSHIADDTTEVSRKHEDDSLDSNEGAGTKILVIDDEELILSMIREGLTRHGYEVDVAADGATALLRLKQNQSDVVFCDWKMPGLNGRQVYENLRIDNPGLCQRFVFVTGDVINEQMREFLEGENRPCLAKPFTFEELRDAIKIVLAAA